MQPSSPMEWACQPLLWNPNITDGSGRMLGMDVELPWADLEKEWLSGGNTNMKSIILMERDNKINNINVQQVRESQIWCSNRLSDIWPTKASIRYGTFGNLDVK